MAANAPEVHRDPPVPNRREGRPTMGRPSASKRPATTAASPTSEVVRRAKPVCELTVDVSRFFEADLDVPAVRRRLFAFVNTGAANVRCGLQREYERRTPCDDARECRLPNQMNGRLLRLFSNSTESSRRLQKSSVGREDFRIALREVRLNSRHGVQILAQHALQRTGPSGARGANFHWTGQAAWPHRTVPRTAQARARILMAWSGPSPSSRFRKRARNASRSARASEAV